MSNIELLKVFLWICFGGWGLYLSSERGRIVGDIKDLKEKQGKLEETIALTDRTISTGYLTRTEHKDFDNRISKSIDNLSERIDRVLQQLIMNHSSK